MLVAHQNAPQAPYLKVTVLDCSRVKVHVQCDTTSTAAFRYITSIPTLTENMATDTTKAAQ